LEEDKITQGGNHISSPIHYYIIVLLQLNLIIIIIIFCMKQNACKYLCKFIC